MTIEMNSEMVTEMELKDAQFYFLRPEKSVTFQAVKRFIQNKKIVGRPTK